MCAWMVPGETAPPKDPCDKTWSVINVEDWTEVRRFYLPVPNQRQRLRRRLLFDTVSQHTATSWVPKPPALQQPSKISESDTKPCAWPSNVHDYVSLSVILSGEPSPQTPQEPRRPDRTWTTTVAPIGDPFCVNDDLWSITVL